MVAVEPSFEGAGDTPAAVALLAVGGSKPASVTAGYNDASQEIADIDSRLHALQNFLRSAKSSRP